jgi:hypothetical protein
MTVPEVPAKLREVSVPKENISDVFSVKLDGRVIFIHR